MVEENRQRGIYLLGCEQFQQIEFPNLLSKGIQNKFDCFKCFCIKLYGAVSRVAARATTRTFLCLLGVGCAIGTKEKLRVSARSRLNQRVLVVTALEYG